MHHNVLHFVTHNFLCEVLCVCTDCMNKFLPKGTTVSKTEPAARKILKHLPGYIMWLQALFFKSCLYTTSSTTFIYIVRFSWLTKSVLGSLSRKYRTEQRLCYILTIALSKGWLYLTFYRLLRPWSNIGKKISQRARNWKISVSKTETILEWNLC